MSLSFFFRFGVPLSYESPQELDLCSEEFTSYQLLQDSDIPKDIWDKATYVADEGRTYHRLDVLWHNLSAIRAPDCSLGIII